MAQDLYQLRGVTDEVLNAIIEGILSIHENVDAIYAPHVIFSACLEYQRATYVEGSYDISKEVETGQQLIDDGILETGFVNEAQVTSVVFRILRDTADIEVFLYQISQGISFRDGNFGPVYLAFMSEIVRQSRTIFGGGNAMGNLMSGNATLDYILDRTDKNSDEIFDDYTLVTFVKAVRGEVAHNPWLLHDGGQFDPFNMEDVYLGAVTLNRLFYEVGHLIFGHAIKDVVNLEAFNFHLDSIRETQTSLGWVYHKDSEGWDKTK